MGSKLFILISYVIKKKFEIGGTNADSADS